MTSNTELKNQPQRFGLLLTVWAFVTLAVLLAGGRASATVVTNCTDANLRAAIAVGGVVTFACDGTISLTNTIPVTMDTWLDATGHTIAISGSNAVRVFHVSTNVAFAVVNLAIANGRASGSGGIHNAGGTVNATNIVFLNNRAMGYSSPPSSPPLPGGDATGGAIGNLGLLNVVNCSFVGNLASGGSGSPGTSGINGAPPGGPGGTGFGGAICNAGLLIASGCTFVSNSAAGGFGGPGGSVLTSSFPAKGGDGGAGGRGDGGAIFNNAGVHLINCTLAFNTGAGGSGGPGGSGSLFPYPGPPGDSGSPGTGFGGISDASGQCHLTNCTLALNACTGYSANPGTSSCGGIKTSGAIMINTLLSENIPGGNCLGSVTDAGHNLSSDSSCAFTQPGSMNSTDPRVGPLTANGGPTLTMALLAGSPAIDAADNVTAPPLDQRGFPRAGTAADIGAFEYGSMLPFLSIDASAPGVLDIIVQGNADKTCRLFASTNLLNWYPLATNQIGAGGSILFHDYCAPGTRACFYRVVMP